MKQLLSAFVFMALILSLSCDAFAHSAETGYYHNSSFTEWDIYETSAHWESYSTPMTIDCGDFVGTAFQAWIVNSVYERGFSGIYLIGTPTTSSGYSAHGTWNSDSGSF